MKTSIKYVLAALLISCLSIVNAKADSLYTGAVSYHISKTTEVNNNNHKLLAYKHKYILAGVYDNSFSETTVFAALPITTYAANNWEVNMNYGFSHGYRQCFAKDPEQNQNKSYFDDDKRFCFHPTLELSYTKYKVQPTLMIIGAATVLTLKWDLK